MNEEQIPGGGPTAVHPGALPAYYATGIMHGLPQASAFPRFPGGEAASGDFGIMRESDRKPDWVGRGVGLLVFAVGIGLLVTLFVQITRLGADKPPTGESLDAAWAVGFGIRVVTLFTAGLVASWIAGRGAQLYAAANRAASGD